MLAIQERLRPIIASRRSTSSTSLKEKEKEKDTETRTAYLVLIVLGAALPLYFFIPFLLENGPDVRLFFAELFANAIGRFFAMDVLVSGVVTIVFTLSEPRRLAIRSGPLCLLGLLVGVSVALPLFLFVRHRHVAGRQSATPQRTAEAASCRNDG